MDSRRGSSSRFFLLLSLVAILSVLAAPSSAQPPNTSSIDSLDSAIRGYAYQTILRRPRTGVLQQLLLPANLSGVEASVVRLRTGSVWVRGANYTPFHIPPRTSVQPFARRIAIVYQNLGGRSSSYVNLPGYSPVSPVVALLAYDATNTTTSVRELDLNATEDPIAIRFGTVAVLPQLSSSTRCVLLGRNGSFEFIESPTPSTCSTRRQGHFTIVVPSMTPDRQDHHPGGGGSTRTEGRRELESSGSWWVWVVACGGGVVGVAVVGVVGVGICRLVGRVRRERMIRRAEEGEELGTVWVRGSKMPIGGPMRTKPVLENGSAPYD